MMTVRYVRYGSVTAIKRTLLGFYWNFFLSVCPFIFENRMATISHPENKPKTNQTMAHLFKTISDFPKPGIQWLDISPLLAHPQELQKAIEQLAGAYALTPIDVVAGLDARGFIPGILMAQALQKPFVMIRKPNKLPGPVITADYKLEYGTNTLQIQENSIQPHQKVLIVDDILATGGTILAAAQLIQPAQVVGVCCFADIGLGGSEKIQKQLNITPKCLEAVPPPEPDLISNAASLGLDWREMLALSSFIRDSIVKEKYIVLYHPSMKSVAQTLKLVAPAHMQLETIQWNHFPDGFPNITFPDDLCGQRVIFLASMYNINEWLEQLSVMMVLPRQAVRSLDIFVPYFAPATMERIDVPGILATADTFAQLSTCCISPTPNGVPTLSVYDLHNIASFSSFDHSKVCFRPLSALEFLLAYIDDVIPVDYVVAFPDEGSFKRFRTALCKIRPDQIMAKFSKTRIGDERHLKLLEISNGAVDFSGFEHVLILDDLVQSGQTLHECHMAIKALGAKKVYAACTHAVFPGRSYLDFLPGGSKAGLERFFITDSNPQRANLLDKQDPFQVVSLAQDMLLQIAKRHEQ